MSEQGIVGRADLQKKDKGELQAIVAALGGKSASRDRKADLIDKVLELSGVVVPPRDAAPEPVAETAPSALPFDQASSSDPAVVEEDSEKAEASTAPSSTKKADSPRSRAARGRDTQTSSEADKTSSESDQAASAADADVGQRGSNEEPVGRDGSKRGDRGSKESRQSQDQGQRRQRNKRGRGGEPPAEWETDLSGDAPKTGSSKSESPKPDVRRGEASKPARNQGGNSSQGGNSNQGGNSGQGNSNQGGNSSQGNSNGQGGNSQTSQDGEDSDSGNRRRRRRGRNRDREDEVATLEPVAVSGFMELREDGYGFLRVSGWMPSKDDVYVPVRMVRQCGLRKGDHVVGTARPANRNEKNPAMENIETINGQAPDEVKNRPIFDELTPLYPSEQLRLERADAPQQLTSRIVDLVAPLGKGQRGLIVSPPKAGKTTLLKDLAKSIEQNNPEAQLVVLLIDERPEEVTDIERSLEHGEVVASTFDRPAEEHCALAELTIERAKRLVEAGEDVIILLDGITRLVRAYNMGGPSSGRQMPGGLDIAAIYPVKRFFGSARNLEDGGSLTILATAAVETGSRMDEVIFEEFTGTSNMELRLDRNLAEREIFPAIDITASSTRRSDLLGEPGENDKREKLAETLGSLDGAESSSSVAIEFLVERLSVVSSNADFLGEIATS